MFSLSGIPVGKETQGSFMMCGKEKAIQESVLDLILPQGNWKGHAATNGSPQGYCSVGEETHEEFVSPQS